VTRTAAATLALLAAAIPAAGRGQTVVVEPQFLFKLSTTTGVVPFHGAAVGYDPYHKETLVVGGGRIRIFNAAGMEIYSFGEDPQLGSVISAVATEDGDFLLLSFGEGESSVVRTNFRGEFKERIVPRGLPPAVPQPFIANAFGYAKQRIYLADLAAMRLVVVGMDGAFLTYHDLAEVAEVPDKRVENGVKGFRVASNGDVLFTVQPLFKAFILHPDGTYTSFGQRGSAPGKFNVITGIAMDERGYYYVVDVLKSAVLVFDKDFKWLREFGYRGTRPGSIFAPVDVAAGDGKVYVSQFANKGVSVFEIKVTIPE
jgi:hypothetical protein